MVRASGFCKQEDEIADLLKLCNSRNAIYLLDVPPDNNGILPEIYVDRLKEVGERLK